MTGTETDGVVRESRAARRLGRLFKIEREGGFDRLSVTTVQRLIERRAGLVKELLLLGDIRRSAASPGSTGLDLALRQLASEVQQSLYFAQTRVERLGGDLRLRRGEGLPTGIRDSANGRLLGSI